MFPERFSNLPAYAFPRLRALLDVHAPGGDVVHMTIGEPKHAFPEWIVDVIAENAGGFGQYPVNEGMPALLSAITGWVARRYGVTLDPGTRVMALNGTREGLYNAMMALCPEQKRGERPVVLLPNPFYQVYMVAALSVGAEPVFCDATRETGHLPDVSALAPEVLDRVSVAYLCSPSNPQGAVASRGYWADLVALAEKARRRVHVLHITTAEEIDFLAGHKDLVTVETTPQHLTLAGPEAYERLGTKAQMNPPIREAHHRDGLWRGIAQGVVDVIGSDHAPHTLEEKAKPYPASPSGMTGVQTLVPVMLTHVAEGRLSLARFVDLTSAGPARIFGIAGKGRIARGYDADFTVVDLKTTREITDAWIASRCGWTPFDGFQAKGWAVATIIRGTIVMRDDELQGTAMGQPVRFQECYPV